MRLVTFEIATPLGPFRRIGAYATDGRIIDLTLAHLAMLSDRGVDNPRERERLMLPAEMLDLLRLGPGAIETAREALGFVVENGVEEVDGVRLVHGADEVRLRAPLPRPNSLRDFLAVEEHVRGSLGEKIPEEWFNIPAYYKANVDEIYGPDDVVPWPAYTDKLDYELEVCAVIGSPGRGIPVERAAEHIVGYTLYNDWSARDIQMREMSIGVGPGLGKDFGTSIGPCIATPDEFDRDTAHLEARIDGEVWSSGVLGRMHFSFEEIIAWISQEQTLHPGDLLGSGTVGKGCGLELDKWLKPESTVELSAEGIGVLRNTVSAKGAGSPSRDAKTQIESEA